MEQTESEKKMDGRNALNVRRDTGIEPATSSFLRNLVFRRGDQLKTQILRPLCEPFEKALLVLFFIALLTNIRVFMSKLHHAVNKDSDFVSCSDDAFRLS